MRHFVCVIFLVIITVSQVFPSDHIVNGVFLDPDLKVRASLLKKSDDAFRQAQYNFVLNLRKGTLSYSNKKSLGQYKYVEDGEEIKKWKLGEVNRKIELASLVDFRIVPDGSNTDGYFKCFYLKPYDEESATLCPSSNKFLSLYHKFLDAVIEHSSRIDKDYLEMHYQVFWFIRHYQNFFWTLARPVYQHNNKFENSPAQPKGDKTWNRFRKIRLVTNDGAGGTTHTCEMTPYSRTGRRENCFVKEVGNIYGEPNEIYDRDNRPDGNKYIDRQAYHLINEALIAYLLKGHPNIIHMYDVATYRDRLYIFLEAGGQSLSAFGEEEAGEVQAQINIDPADLLDNIMLLDDNEIDVLVEWVALVNVVTYRFFTGLKYMHDHKIFHMDMKPGNVVINDDLQLKIIDFGYSQAKIFGDSGDNFWRDAQNTISGGYHVANAFNPDDNDLEARDSAQAALTILNGIIAPLFEIDKGTQLNRHNVKNTLREKPDENFTEIQLKPLLDILFKMSHQNTRRRMLIRDAHRELGKTIRHWESFIQY